MAERIGKTFPDSLVRKESRPSFEAAHQNTQRTGASLCRNRQQRTQYILSMLLKVCRKHNCLFSTSYQAWPTLEALQPWAGGSNSDIDRHFFSLWNIIELPCNWSRMNAVALFGLQFHYCVLTSLRIFVHFRYFLSPIYRPAYWMDLLNCTFTAWDRSFQQTLPFISSRIIHPGRDESMAVFLSPAIALGVVAQEKYLRVLVHWLKVLCEFNL